MKKINLLHIITELELGGAQKATLYILQYINRQRFNLYFISSPRGLLKETVKKFSNVNPVRKDEALDHTLSRNKDVDLYSSSPRGMGLSNGVNPIRDSTQVPPALPIPNGVNVYFLPCLRRKISPINDLRAFLHIYFYIRKNKIDIVHTHSSKAGILGRLAAKLAKTRYIFHTIHGFSFNSYQPYIIRKLFIFLERLTSRITNKLIAVAENDIKKGLKERIGKQGQYVLIREGIEKNLFALSEGVIAKGKNNFNIKQDAKVVGMVACLKPQKAPADFVKIAKIVSDRLPSVKFFLIGDGFLRNNVEKMVDKLGLNGRFFLLGWRKNIHKIMPVLDVVVLTSYWEGLPHTLLEAMYCSKPVVAYGVDGVCEIIEDGVNGFVIKPGDIKTFTERIFQLLKDKYLVQQIGNSGHRMVKDRFNINEMVSKTEQLYFTQMSADTALRICANL